MAVEEQKVEVVFCVENCSLQLTDGGSLESVIGQLQYHHNQLILWVEDGTLLRVSQRDEFSFTLKKHLESKKVRYGVTEYYFRDDVNESLYCFFGEEAAYLAHPSLRTEETLPRGPMHLSNEEISLPCETEKISC